VDTNKVFKKSVNYFLALMKDAKKELLILTENKN